MPLAVTADIATALMNQFSTWEYSYVLLNQECEYGGTV
jgi:hypothetical protein